MKRSVIEERLNEAMQRRASAQSDERYLTGQIEYHDWQASEIRKDRQKARSKLQRAEQAIQKYSGMLAAAVEG